MHVDLGTGRGLDEAAFEAWRRSQGLLEAWRSGLGGRSETPVGRSPVADLGIAAKYLGLAAHAEATGRVLDIGCGGGHRARHFPGKRYVGLDVSTVGAGRGFPFAQAMAEFLPFRPASFDAVVAVELIDHVVDPGRVVAEMARVLVPHGAVMVFVATRERAEDREAYEDRQRNYGVREDAVHLSDFTATSLSGLLTRAFAKVEVDRVAGYLAGWGYSPQEP